MAQDLLARIEPTTLGRLKDRSNEPWWTEGNFEYSNSRHRFMVVADTVMPGTALLEMRQCYKKAPVELKKSFDYKRDALVSICVDDTPEAAIGTFFGERESGYSALSDLPVPPQVIQGNHTLLLDRLDATAREWGLTGWVAFVPGGFFEQLPTGVLDFVGLEAKPTPVGFEIRRRKASA